MFTGIVQDTGKIISMKKRGSNISFIAETSRPDFLNSSAVGSSISINGACMTIETIAGKKFRFTTVKESLSKTNLGILKKDSIVNLELPATFSSAIDGHIVQGHVDTTGIVKKISKLSGSHEFFISLSGKHRELIIALGSIAINGVSLTIASIDNEDLRAITVKVAIIPHTYRVTNFRKLCKNDLVNIEFDILGKYVQRILNSRGIK